MACRCATLKEVFGGDAPATCGPCDLARQRSALVSMHHVLVDSGTGSCLTRLGVAIVRLSEDEQWCPDWAHDIFREFGWDMDAATQVIERAAQDTLFLGACRQIIDLCTYGVWSDDDKTAAERMTAHLKARS